MKKYFITLVLLLAFSLNIQASDFGMGGSKITPLVVTDSMNGFVDSSVASNLPLPEMSAPEVAAEPPVKLSVELVEDKITLGEPLFIKAKVSWPAMPMPILVIPDLKDLDSWVDLDSMQAKQLKGIKDGQAYTEMNYTLRVYPRKSGELEMSGISFQYRWGGELKSLKSEPLKITVKEKLDIPASFIWSIVGLLVVAILFFYIRQAKQEKTNRKRSKSHQIDEWQNELERLSAKVSSMREKEWLEGLEALCMDWLSVQNKNISENLTFEELLSKYNVSEDHLDDWTHLKEEFYYAHYAAGAGGGRDVFQLKADLAMAKKLMNLEE